MLKWKFKRRERQLIEKGKCINSSLARGGAMYGSITLGKKMEWETNRFWRGNYVLQTCAKCWF